MLSSDSLSDELLNDEWADEFAEEEEEDVRSAESEYELCIALDLAPFPPLDDDPCLDSAVETPPNRA